MEYRSVIENSSRLPEVKTWVDKAKKKKGGGGGHVERVVGREKIGLDSD